MMARTTSTAMAPSLRQASQALRKWERERDAEEARKKRENAESRRSRLVDEFRNAETAKESHYRLSIAKLSCQATDPLISTPSSSLSLTDR